MPQIASLNLILSFPSVRAKSFCFIKLTVPRGIVLLSGFYEQSQQLHLRQVNTCGKGSSSVKPVNGKISKTFGGFFINLF